MSTANSLSTALPLPKHGHSGRDRRYGLVARVGSTLVGQVLLSGLHFVLHLHLVRVLPAAEYGVFAFAFTMAIFGLSVSYPLVATPLAVYTAGVERQAARAATEVALGAVNLVLVGAIFVGTVVLMSIVAAGMAGALAGGSFAAAYANRSSTRALVLARHRGELALVGDAACVGLALFILVAAGAAMERPSMIVALLALAVGNLAGSLAELTLLGGRLRLSIRGTSLRRYRRLWTETRWSLVGSAATVLQAQAHALLVSLLAGPAAFAPLAAGQIAFSPVRVGIFALQSALRPELASAGAQGERRRVWLVVLGATAALVLGLLSLAALLTLYWRPLATAIYGGSYDLDQMAWVVCLNGGIALCTALSAGGATALQVLRRFELLARASLCGAALSLVVVMLVLSLGFPTTMTLLGVLLGELVILGAVLSGMWSWLRR